MAGEDDSERPERPAPHDALFKLAFERPEHAEGLLRSLLPSEASERIDFTTLELVPGSFRDAELRDVETDLLFRVELEGREAFIYTLLEHQSSVDPTMPWRLLRYMVRIWESWKREHPRALQLPAIVPLVLAHGPAPWTVPTSFLDTLNVTGPARRALEPLLVNFEYVVKDLAVESAAALRLGAEATAMARLTLFLLQRGRASADLLEELRGWTEVLRELRRAGGDDLVAVVMYSWVVSDVAPARWRAFLRDELNTDPDEVMGAAEKLIAQIGPPKWLAEGRAQGKAELLLKQLARRFGPVPESLEARVRAAAPLELDEMAERMFDAASAAEVVGR